MATLTINIPDARVARIQDAMKDLNAGNPATLAQIQNFIRGVLFEEVIRRERIVAIDIARASIPALE